MAKTDPRSRLTHALLLVFYSFVLLSCASYSWTDWPSGRLAPHPWPVANLCGPVGAWLAYQVLSFLGYAVFVVLIFAAAWSLLRLLNREIVDLLLRGIGLALLVLSISAISYLLIPSLNFPATNPLPFTAGGVVGLLLGSFLLDQLSRWGSALVLTASLLVGLLLAADSSVVFLLQLLWSKLSTLLAKVPVLRVVLRRPIALAGALPRINPHRGALQQLAGPAGGVTAVALDAQEPCAIFSPGSPGPQVELSCGGTAYRAMITPSCPPPHVFYGRNSDDDTIDTSYLRMIHDKIQQNKCEDYRRDITKYFFYSMKTGGTVDVDIASLTDEAKATWPAECPQHMIVKSRFTSQ